MRWVSPHPCIGASDSVLRMSRSSVPCRTCSFVFCLATGVPPGCQEDVGHSPPECQEDQDTLLPYSRPSSHLELQWLPVRQTPLRRSSPTDMRSFARLDAGASRRLYSPSTDTTVGTSPSKYSALAKRPIAEHIAAQRTLPRERVTELLAEMLGVLEYLHT